MNGDVSQRLKYGFLVLALQRTGYDFFFAFSLFLLCWAYSGFLQARVCGSVGGHFDTTDLWLTGYVSTINFLLLFAFT